MTLSLLWFILIVVLIAGYYVLDGFDLGVGILSPFVAKTDKEKQALISSVGPLWDGNEVWLLTAGGALFAAFAPAYATAFSGFYLAIMLVLFGLIVRAVSLEFMAHDQKRQRMWQILFFVGSLLPALLFGVALGNCLQGIPLNENGDYIGGFFGLLGIFPLVCGLLGLSTIIAQGACWIAAKIEPGTALQIRAVAVRRIMIIVSTVIIIIATLFVFFAHFSDLANAQKSPLIFVFFALVLIAGIIISLYASLRGKDWTAFIANSVVCVAILALFAATIFPYLIVASAGESISIVNASSSDLSLTIMTIIACIGVPLVLVYHVIIYRIFAGRVSVND